MNNLIVKYHNLDTDKLTNLTRKDQDIIKDIQSVILNLPALNIIYNDELLNRTIIQGEIPSATNPPSGCVFRTRCPNPTNDCKEGNTEMALIEIEPQHWVDQCCVNCK